MVVAIKFASRVATTGAGAAVNAVYIFFQCGDETWKKARKLFCPLLHRKQFQLKKSPIFLLSIGFI